MTFLHLIGAIVFWALLLLVLAVLRYVYHDLYGGPPEFVNHTDWQRISESNQQARQEQRQIVQQRTGRQS